MEWGEVRRYYGCSAVSERMWEFLGGRGPEATAVFITPCDDPFGRGPVARSPLTLNAFLRDGTEVGRSLWDRESLVAHLDVEYVNFDFPAEPYLDPERTFRLQRPVFAAVREVLGSYGIRPLFLLSGRGFHAVWRVERHARAVSRAAALGHVDEEMMAYYAQRPGPGGLRVDRRLALAHSALGLVMEYVTHRLKQRLCGALRIPLEITALEVAAGQRGRELVSLDISEYGDPLIMRMVRVPFSLYLKPWRKAGVLPPDSAVRIPLMVLAPIEGESLSEAMWAMRDMETAGKLAQRLGVSIPACGEGMERLIAAYDASALALFHRRYYHERHHPPARWASSYDRLEPEALPAPAAHVLRSPNDRLLKPAGIRHVVRALTDRGWHPRHVAGLLRSKYERDYGWGHMWYAYHAATRADFYVRLFAGLIDAGLDEW
jgi:hypothetical protein